MGEVFKEAAVRREWSVPCCESSGVEGVCLVSSYGGVVRIALVDDGEWLPFFELRDEQVSDFWVGLVSTLGVAGAGGSEEPADGSCWWGQCFDQRDELSKYVIEMKERDVLRVGWVIQVSDLPAVLSWERSFELRGHQIKVFYEALAAATKVCADDIPIHGEHRADKELAVAPLPPIPETEFTALVNQIVADEAPSPSQLAVVAEFGERADGMILAWGVRRSGRIELDSADYEYTRVSFSSPENIWRKFSIHGEMQIRTVSVNEAQKHVEAHRSHGQMTDPR